MPIDFFDPLVRRTYADRSASPSWHGAILDIIGDARDKVIVDVGCGGGTYSQAWLDLGASQVIGVDISAQFLETASEAISDDRFDVVQADAAHTGLTAESADIVFGRALVHHLSSPGQFAAECARIVRPGGWVIVQDRTLEDVEQPPAPDHPRGYFFSVHPHLLTIEQERRPTASAMAEDLTMAGLTDVKLHQLWEERRSYESVAEYQADIAARTGRSILHDLTDAELDDLVCALGAVLPAGRVIERDRWTLWTGNKPC
ncbi:class I SAM-dependent methyltransferase [Microbacterium oryzae]|uniref:class I SAM-dependent methyltransferase n=1 Tax=Microbacterium oryzae TaxID=743009 RepID=UPI001565262B|nr:class I SAM-dependent methyltransferase [Microbacterium oryzae]